MKQSPSCYEQHTKKKKKRKKKKTRNFVERRLKTTAYLSIEQKNHFLRKGFFLDGMVGDGRDGMWVMECFNGEMGLRG